METVGRAGSRSRLQQAFDGGEESDNLAAQESAIRRVVTHTEHDELQGAAAVHLSPLDVIHPLARGVFALLAADAVQGAIAVD